MSKEIIKEILKQLNNFGVRYLNGDDLTAVNGVVHANMAIDLTESRLEVVVDEGSFTLIFGNSKAVYNNLMNNPILKPFIIVNESIKLTFYVRKKAGFGSYQIGKNKRSFKKITNFTLQDANLYGNTSSKNGDCEWKTGDEIELVERNKEIVNYFYNEFKERTFYKEWEYSEEKIRQGLNLIKNI